MNWKNALRDEQPENDQEVLIAVKGVYYVATYKEDLQGFYVDKNNFIPSKDDTIYWVETPDSNL